MTNEEQRVVRNRNLKYLAALAFACLAGAAWGADPSEYSEAERQLFVRPHMESLVPPVRLHYRYVRKGSLQPEVTDSAVVEMAPGSRTAKVEYLSGDRKLELPTIESAVGNPVILHFLEREVRELRRLTGGSVTYYRNRIRKALAGDATVRQRQVTFHGRDVEAVEIRVDPFVKDPARDRFEKFADRYYVMVLSPEIPGEVLEMKAELMGRDGTAEAGKLVQSEVLTFERREGARE